jgi:hypothetical protein
MDLELLRQVLADDRLHILLGVIKRVAVSSDRSVCQVIVSILPEKREIVAKMGWEVVGDECGMFMLPNVNDLVLVAQAEGDVEQAYVIRRLTSSEDKIPLNAANGDFVLKSKAGKKMWVTSDTRVNISKADNSATQNLVLGQVLKSCLSTLIAAIASHTHDYTDNGTPLVTGAPKNASAITAVKTSPVDDGLMLSDFAFTEK